MKGELGELFQKKRSTLKHTLLVHIMEIKYLCKPNVIFSHNEMHVNCISIKIYYSISVY